MKTGKPFNQFSKQEYLESIPNALKKNKDNLNRAEIVMNEVRSTKLDVRVILRNAMDGVKLYREHPLTI